MKCKKVENKAIVINATADKYFPITMSLSSIGSVEIISIVPSPFSREIRPIVIPGIKNKYTSGTILNNVLRSDWPYRKKVVVKNHPLRRANTIKKT